MRFVEIHPYADARLVSGGFTHFVWSIGSADLLPVFNEQYGAAIELGEGVAGPEPYARYNPTTDTFAAPLAFDAVPGLAPYYTALWDNETMIWTIAEIS